MVTPVEIEVVPEQIMVAPRGRSTQENEDRGYTNRDTGHPCIDIGVTRGTSWYYQGLGPHAKSKIKVVLVKIMVAPT